MSDDPFTIRLMPLVRLGSALQPTPADIDSVGNVKNQYSDHSIFEISGRKCSLNNQSSIFGEAFSCAFDGSKVRIRVVLPAGAVWLKGANFDFSGKRLYPHTFTLGRAVVPIEYLAMLNENCEHGREEKSWAVYFEALTYSKFLHPPVICRDIVGKINLQFAVMEETVRCLLRFRLTQSPAGWREMSEAMQWVNLHGNHDRFSFDSICQDLKMDSGVLRQRLNSLSRSFRSRSPFFRR